MADESNSYAEAWKPTPGATLTGTMTAVEMIDPNNAVLSVRPTTLKHMDDPLCKK